MYTGKIIASESLDPMYAVQFSYVSDNYRIIDGKAIFTRNSPYPKVIFDEYTDYMLEKSEIDTDSLSQIKLCVGNTVFEYLFNRLK